MKTVSLIVGIVLVVAGVFSLATGGLSFTHRKTDVDAGPIQISHNSTRTLPVAPVVSIVALLAGGGLIVAGIRMR